MTRGPDLPPEGLLLPARRQAALSALPLVEPERLAAVLGLAVAQGARLALLTGVPEGDGGLTVLSVLADDRAARLRLLATPLGPVPRRWAAITPTLLQAHLFERELLERHGLRPDGHPGPLPVRGERDGAAPPHAWAEEVPFERIEGSAVHEVAVGPVHAGIIEPGHFRFQCHGEDVLHLEIRLGYQHRGVEALLVAAASDARRLVLLESIAGDSAVGHALAGVQALEALALARVPPRAVALRAVALELERVASHIGDLGAISGDIAFQPGAASFAALRGEFLNLLMDWTGSRHGRGLVVPGGVRTDLGARFLAAARERLAVAHRRLERLLGLLFAAPSVLARLEGIGVLPGADALSLGLVGLAARASGLAVDVRHDHPEGVSDAGAPERVVGARGDVLARALQRRGEALASLRWLERMLAALPPGPTCVPLGPLARESLGVGLVEGWRGELLHLVLTDDVGRVRLWRAKDASFHAWSGLAAALRGQALSDFPLINKSFNLSYAGHDL